MNTGLRKFKLDRDIRIRNKARIFILKAYAGCVRPINDEVLYTNYLAVPREHYLAKSYFIALHGKLIEQYKLKQKGENDAGTV